jgi:hypothetical protein
MTRQTTALITAGPRTISAWGDRAWRVSVTAQLVEGSDPAYWIVTPTQPALHAVSPEVIEVDMPYSESVVESVIMLLATHLGNEQVERLLLESHLVSLDGGVRRIAPYWSPLADDVIVNLSRRLSQSVRIGITIMDELSLVTDETVSVLRDNGFDVDVFSLSSSAIIAAT